MALNEDGFDLALLRAKFAEAGIGGSPKSQMNAAQAVVDALIEYYQQAEPQALQTIEALCETSDSLDSFAAQF